MIFNKLNYKIRGCFITNYKGNDQTAKTSKPSGWRCVFKENL